MRAAAWKDDLTLAVEERVEPEPSAGQVLIEVSACGICGTDLHLYRGEFKAMPGIVPGHEIAGVVRGGEGFAAGTAVAIDPMLSCLQCADCRNAQSTVCQRSRLMGISADGGLQQQILAPAANVYPLPPGFDAALGSLVEPLAVAVRGVHRAKVPLGARVLVLGSGTIGLMTAMLLRDTAGEVAVTGRYEHQREAALKIGASAAFDPSSPDLRAWSRARRPDVVIETVGGSADTLADAFRFVRAGGTVCALGVFTGMTSLNGFRLVNEEITLVSSVMYGRAAGNSEFGVAAALIGRYRDELAVFRTHHFALGEVGDAFAAAADKTSGALKVTVLPQQ